MFKLRSAPILLQQLREKHQGESKIIVHDFLSPVFTDVTVLQLSHACSHVSKDSRDCYTSTQNLVSKQLYSYQLFRKILMSCI